MCESVCVCVFVCLRVLVLHPFIFHFTGHRAQDLCSECNIDEVDFAGRMPFQPFIFWVGPALIQKPSLEMPKTIHQYGKAKMTKTILV